MKPQFNINLTCKSWESKNCQESLFGSNWNILYLTNKCKWDFWIEQGKNPSGQSMHSGNQGSNKLMAPMLYLPLKPSISGGNVCYCMPLYMSCHTVGTPIVIKLKQCFSLVQYQQTAIKQLLDIYLWYYERSCDSFLFSVVLFTC